MSQKKASNQVELNSEELKVFLKHMISNNNFIQKQGKIPVSINVMGEAGIGKTSSIIELAKELDLQLVKINLSQLEEIGDLVGFNIKEFQIENSEGKTTWIIEQQIETAIKKGYKIIGKRMSYAVPEWIQGKSENGILFFDDFNRADSRFITAAMEIIDRQEYISWKLPKNWTIILSQNPDDGNYMVNSQDLAQQTRYISVNFKFDVNVWSKWAEKTGMDNRLINFLIMNPELVTKTVNPRIITKFFDSISSISNFNEKLPLIQMIGEGSVGIEFTSMITMFINNKLDKIISPRAIFEKEESQVVNILTSLIGVEKDYRVDIASVIVTRLINYCVLFAATNVVSEDMIKRIIVLISNPNLFTNDLKYYIIRELVNKNKAKFSKLMSNTEVLKISVQ